MSLYTEWRNLSDNHESQEAEVKFWEAYLQAEASIYNELLNNKQEVIEHSLNWYIRVCAACAYFP